MYSDSSPFISHKTHSTTVYLIATRRVKYLFVAVGRWSFKKQRNSRHMPHDTVNLLSEGADEIMSAT